MIPRFISDPDPEIFLSENFLVFDLETTNIDKGSALNKENRLLLSGWTRDGEDIFVCDGNEYEQEHLLWEIENRDFIVAQGSKFDLQWLQRMGVDISKVMVFDTMIAEYVILGNIRKPLDLGSIADGYGYGTKDPYVDLCMKSGICPSTLPYSMLEKRVTKDVKQTYQIFKDQLALLQSQGKLKVFFTKCLLTPVLADIEKNGMCLDEEVVTQEYFKYTNEYIEVEQALDKLTGGINPNSHKQKAEFIYGTLGFKELRDRAGNKIRTAKDQPKTDGDTIALLKATTPEQRAFKTLKKEHGRLGAALSKNLEFFYRVCKEHAGIFTARFNQTIARTGRLTSSGLTIEFADGKKLGVQFQNLPRIFKRLFKARKKGWKIREDDARQLEFRVAGYLGRDATILTFIESGDDIHQYSADTLTAASRSRVSRQDAKAYTFKPLYGGRSGTKAQVSYYEAFRDRFKGITAAQDRWIKTVLKDKELTLDTGQVFYWPDTRTTVSGFITNTNNICNYPVQYLATAEIIPIALIKLWHEIKDQGLSSFIVNTVHDSIITELYLPEEKQYNDIVLDAMTTYVYFYLKQVYNIEFFIPLGVGSKVGDHWSEGEEVKYESVSPYKLDG